MRRNNRLMSRIIAIATIAFGIAFGCTWERTKYCLGDHIFSALGLPSWSNGATGTHYPAIVGLIFILAGIGFLNATLSKKVQLWVWGISVFVFIALYFSFVFM